MAFAVHGTSELAFTGAVAGLLVADNPVVGALVGAVVVATLIGALGQEVSDRDSTIGVILAAGFGLGVLLLGYYHGYASEALNILFGNIFGISSGQILLLAVIAAAATIGLARRLAPAAVLLGRPRRGPRPRRADRAARASPSSTCWPSRSPRRHRSWARCSCSAWSSRRRPRRSGSAPARCPSRCSPLRWPSLAADGGLLLSFQFPSVEPSVPIVASSFAFYVGARLAGPALASRAEEPVRRAATWQSCPMAEPSVRPARPSPRPGRATPSSTSCSAPTTSAAPRTSMPSCGPTVRPSVSRRCTGISPS